MTSRKGRPRLTVYDVREELNTRRTVPMYHQAVRLVIAFKEPGCQYNTILIHCQRLLYLSADKLELRGYDAVRIQIEGDCGREAEEKAEKLERVCRSARVDSKRLRKVPGPFWIGLLLIISSSEEAIAM
jgi:hypothetical protein